MNRPMFKNIWDKSMEAFRLYKILNFFEECDFAQVARYLSFGPNNSE